MGNVPVWFNYGCHTNNAILALLSRRIRAVARLSYMLLRNPMFPHPFQFIVIDVACGWWRASCLATKFVFLIIWPCSDCSTSTLYKLSHRRYVVEPYVTVSSGQIWCISSQLMWNVTLFMGVCKKSLSALQDFCPCNKKESLSLGVLLLQKVHYDIDLMACSTGLFRVLWQCY